MRIRVGHLLVVGVFVVGCLLARPAIGATRSASVVVGARVQAHVRVDRVWSPPALILMERDVARGHVDVVAASRIDVRTNCPEAYSLRFEIAGAPILIAEARGSAGTWSLGPNGGVIRLPVPFPGPHSVELTWRFHLTDEARPGAYPWPITTTASP